MYDGTLAGHWEALVTFQQLIVLADADGVVDVTPQAISARTTIPLHIITAGLEFLALPDPYSRTPGEDGRRIVCLDEHRPWGWQIVNYLKYKHLRDSGEVREQNRVRAQRFRDKRNGSNAVSRDVTSCHTESRHTDTDTDTGREAPPKPQRSHGSRLPSEWFPSGTLTAWALKTRPDLDLPAVVEMFKDHWLSVAGTDGTKRDWEATFRNWIRREKQGRKTQQQAGEVI